MGYPCLLRQCGGPPKKMPSLRSSLPVVISFNTNIVKISAQRHICLLRPLLSVVNSAAVLDCFYCKLFCCFSFHFMLFLRLFLLQRLTHSSQSTQFVSEFPTHSFSQMWVVSSLHFLHARGQFRLVPQPAERRGFTSVQFSQAEMVLELLIALFGKPWRLCQKRFKCKLHHAVPDVKCMSQGLFLLLETLKYKEVITKDLALLCYKGPETEKYMNMHFATISPKVFPQKVPWAHFYPVTISYKFDFSSKAPKIINTCLIRKGKVRVGKEIKRNLV